MIGVDPQTVGDPHGELWEHEVLSLHAGQSRLPSGLSVTVRISDYVEGQQERKCLVVDFRPFRRTTELLERLRSFSSRRA